MRIQFIFCTRKKKKTHEHDCCLKPKNSVTLSILGVKKEKKNAQ